MSADLISAIAKDRDRWYMRACAAEAALAKAPARNPMPPSHEVVEAARLVLSYFDGTRNDDGIMSAVVKLENALGRLSGP